MFLKYVNANWKFKLESGIPNGNIIISENIIKSQVLKLWNSAKIYSLLKLQWQIDLKSNFSWLKLEQIIVQNCLLLCIFLLNVFCPFCFLLLFFLFVCWWSLCNMSGWHRPLKFINILLIWVNMVYGFMPDALRCLPLCFNVWFLSLKNIIKCFWNLIEKEIHSNVTLLHTVYIEPLYIQCKRLCIIYDKLRLCFDMQLLANSTLHRMVSVNGEFQKLVT